MFFTCQPVKIIKRQRPLLVAKKVRKTIIFLRFFFRTSKAIYCKFSKQGPLPWNNNMTKIRIFAASLNFIFMLEAYVNDFRSYKNKCDVLSSVCFLGNLLLSLEDGTQKSSLTKANTHRKVRSYVCPEGVFVSTHENNQGSKGSFFPLFCSSWFFILWPVEENPWKKWAFRFVKKTISNTPNRNKAVSWNVFHVRTHYFPCICIMHAHNTYTDFRLLNE